jgi:hypothetical protein
MELLPTGQKKIKQLQIPLGVVFIRVFLGKRRRVKLGPDWPEETYEYPFGKETVLHICADDG